VTGPNQGAFTYEAGGRKEQAMSPMFGDKCFLCSGKIGESDPRQFYTGPAGSTGVMMLAHTGCLNKFKANGEQWPPPEQPKAPVVQAAVNSFGDGTQRVAYGNAKLAYDAHQMVLLCNAEISQHGLKAVIPDLIVALQAAADTL